MNLFLMIPALILLILGITRAVRLDWKRSVLCLIIAGGLFILNNRQMVSAAKARARAYSTQKKPEDIQNQRNKTGMEQTTSNQQIQAIGASAPQPDL